MLFTDTLSTQNRLIAIFWSLILAKCFALDYLVLKYDVPVNTETYVWALSCGMALAATYVYLGHKININSFKSLFKPESVLNTSCYLSAVVLLFLAVLLGISDSQSLLASLAFLLAFLNFKEFKKQHHATLISNAFIWLLTSVACLFISNIMTAAIFSISILLTFTLPLIYLQFKQHREIKSALKALHAD
jgi:hypothetical protein